MSTEVIQELVGDIVPEVVADQPSAPVVLPEISADSAPVTALSATVERVREVIALPNTFVLRAITKWQFRQTGTGQAVLDRLGPVGDVLQHAGNYVERMGAGHSLQLARIATSGVRTAVTVGGWLAPGIGAALETVVSTVESHVAVLADMQDVHAATLTSQPSHAPMALVSQETAAAPHNANFDLVAYAETDNSDPTRVAEADNPWSGRPANLYDWAREDLETSLRKDGVPEDQIKHLIHNDHNIQPILDAYEKQNADALKARNGNPAGWLYHDETYKTGDAKAASDHVAAGIAQKLGIEPKNPDTGGDTGGNGDGDSSGDQGADGGTGDGQGQDNPGNGRPSASATATPIVPATAQPSAPAVEVPVPGTSGAPSAHPTTHPTPGATSAAPVVDPPSQPGSPEDERLIVTAPWGTRYYADWVLQMTAFTTVELITISSLVSMYKKSRERSLNPGLQLRFGGDNAVDQAQLAHEIVKEGDESDANRERKYELRAELRDRTRSPASKGAYDTMTAILEALRLEAIDWASLTRAERTRRRAEDDADHEQSLRERAEKTADQRMADIALEAYAHDETIDRWTTRLGTKVVSWHAKRPAPAATAATDDTN
jgi:hypothetical protein